MKSYDARMLVVLYGYALVLMFFVSTDSWLYYSFGRLDSAAFFMAGKALMNGMTPYIEFADGKGPVLWLIYGVGYLLSPTSYHGVFVLSTFFVAMALWFVLKTALLYTDESSAIVVTMLVSAFMFLPLFHDETRAETFCWPMIALGVYEALWFCQGSKANVTNIKLLQKGIAVGVAFAAILLIKYTMAAMLLVCMAYVVLMAHKFYHKSNTVMFGMAVGTSAFIVPIAIWLEMESDLGKAIYEYFVVITKTDRVNDTTPLLSMLISYVKCVGMMLLNWCSMLSVSFALILVGTWFFCKTRKCMDETARWAPFAIHLWFVAIASYHSLFIYYYESCSTLACFSFILLTERFKIDAFKWSRKLYLMSIGLVTAIFLAHPFRHPAFVFNSNDETKSTFMEVNEVMKGLGNHPRLLNLALLEMGMGIEAEPLPACKYWFLQNGATKEMCDNQTEAIRNQSADMIITYKNNPIVPLIEKCGYKAYDRNEALEYVSLYMRK